MILSNTSILYLCRSSSKFAFLVHHHVNTPTINWLLMHVGIQECLCTSVASSVCVYVRAQCVCVCVCVCVSGCWNNLFSRTLQIQNYFSLKSTNGDLIRPCCIERLIIHTMPMVVGEISNHGLPLP